MREPNFFVVGAPKAGTTSLCAYLQRHPQIFMSPLKEPCFFAPEVATFSQQTRERAAAGDFVFEWNAYLDLFRGAHTENAIGEGSVSYMGSLTAPLAIRGRIPDARIIMMLRDPVDRLFSHYVAARAAHATDRNFVPWVLEQHETEATRVPVWGPVWAGRYGVHLGRFLEAFPRSQVHVAFYEDYVRAPARLYRDLLTFLDVDPDFPLDATTRLNVTRVPRWPGLARPSMAPFKSAVRALVSADCFRQLREAFLTSSHPGPRSDEREQLRELYADDVRTLQSMVGRDLSSWLGPGRPAAV